MNNLQKRLFYLIETFVSRQLIVRNAIQELRPDFILGHDENVPLEELIKVAESTLGTPGTGIWKDDNSWHYYLHGGGCRLTNVDTGELLEWDAPDLDKFYDEWFINWLRWYDDTFEETQSKFKAMSKSEIRAILLSLKEMKLIEKITTYHFRLIVKSSSTVASTRHLCIPGR